MCRVRAFAAAKRAIDHSVMAITVSGEKRPTPPTQHLHARKECYADAILKGTGKLLLTIRAVPVRLDR